MNDSFKSYHPVVNFTFFTAVIVFSMFLMHPAAQAISLCTAFTYSVYLNGKRAVKFQLRYMLPLLVLTALANPAFNHEGATILWYLWNGNPITQESILYGIAAGVLFVSVILWFSCYNAVMTSDKFIYLFGRIIPALSLIFSMVMRFVPRFIAQLKVISNAQKCIGRDISQGSLLQRAKNGIRILSIMLTWALENGVETADSMKSRGYGLKGRTAFSIFRFQARDGIALAAILAFSLVTFLSSIYGGLDMRFFPTVKIPPLNTLSVLSYIAYFALCMTPMAINLWEEKKWNYLQSRI